MINFEAIGQAIFDSAVRALGEGAQIVAIRAKARAPVRRLFADGDYRVRFKSISEVEADRGLRASLGLGPERTRGPYRARTTFGAHPPVHWRERRSTAAAALLESYQEAPASAMLTSRGAYEVRTKRASFSTWQHLKVGGRLRGEIYATAPKVMGSRAEAWVISPTPYAKYMEFGTRHNAAHPYLRPALEESRSEIVSRIAAAVKEAARTQGSNTEIEIAVRL